MAPIFANVKASYERLKKLPQTASSVDQEPVHGTAFEAEAKPCNKRIRPGRCPALPFWSSMQSYTEPPVEALNGLFTCEPAGTNMDFCQDDSSWLEDTLNVNMDVGSDMGNWNFDSMI
jgi:hypothetical protein